MGVSILEIPTDSEKERIAKMGREYIWQESDDGYVSTRIRELVRCKDCKHFKPDTEGDGGLCMIIMHGCRNWGFCADGDRKDRRISTWD